MIKQQEALALQLWSVRLLRDCSGGGGSSGEKHEFEFSCVARFAFGEGVWFVLFFLKRLR